MDPSKWDGKIKSSLPKAIKYIESMIKEGCKFSEANIKILAGGEDTKQEKVFSRFSDFKNLNKLIYNILNK